MPEQHAPWREIVAEMLSLLASERQQLDYENKVQQVDITRELVALWFDTSYHPRDTEFQSHFSKAELAELAAFDAFYRQRIERLPVSNGTVRSWLESPIWREVMNAADQAKQRVAV